MSTTARQPEAPGKQLANHEPARVKLAVRLLFAVALTITIVLGIANAASPFIYMHASVSADVATTARTFATEGVFRLRGVPVDNNPPIGAGDLYTHWPPLFPILLSGFFHLFGASERVTHLFMLGILVVSALLVVRLGTIWLGAIGGPLAGYFWLTLPVVVQFGHLAAQQALAMLFLMAALVTFSSHRLKLGALALFFGVLSSWEVALVLPGMWLATRKLPGSRRTAIVATIAVFSAVASVSALFLSNSPALTVGALQTAKFYMGLSPAYSPTILHGLPALSLSRQISGVLWNHLWMLGALGIAALLQLFLARTDDGTWLISCLVSPWITWVAVMRTHTAIHHFELLLAAPLAALALAWAATIDLRKSSSRRAAGKTAVFVAAAAIQILVLPRPHAAHDYPPDRLIRYAQMIGRSTPAGAIIMAPLTSAVPLYYSHRHIVRWIGTPTTLVEELPAILREFPGAPVYLAVPPSLVGDFAPVIHSAQAEKANSEAIVAKIH